MISALGVKEFTPVGPSATVLVAPAARALPALPPVNAPTISDLQDSLAALGVLSMLDSQMQVSAATRGIHGEQVFRGVQIKKELDSIRSAMANKNKSGFWGALASIAAKIAEVAAIVVAAAATVMTAGAGAPLLVAVALALSVGGFLVKETQCFGKASDIVGTCMTVAGSVMSGGGGLAVGAARATTAGVTGLAGAAGAGASAGAAAGAASAASSGLGAAANAVRIAASATSIGSRAVGAAATVGSAVYAAKAAKASGEAAVSHHEGERSALAVEHEIAVMKYAIDQARRTFEMISETLKMRDHSSLIPLFARS